MKYDKQAGDGEMTRQERINALEAILAKIRSGSTCHTCTPLTRDVKTGSSLYSEKSSGDILKLLRREPRSA